MSIRVNNLKWEGSDDDGVYVSTGAGADYSVELSHNGSWYYEDQRHGCSEYAMKAAQADYERRVLASIEIMED